MESLPEELQAVLEQVVIAFLTGDRESYMGLWEMAHEPEAYLKRQKEAIRRFLRELEQEDQQENQTPAEEPPAEQPSESEQREPSDPQSVVEQTPRLEIPPTGKRVGRSPSKRLHDYLGVG